MFILGATLKRCCSVWGCKVQKRTPNASSNDALRVAPGFRFNSERLLAPLCGRITRQKAMIRITDTISIDPRELHEEFVRSSGPGGQNVNKVSTAVELRFDVARSPSLPADVRQRLICQAGSRMTGEGVLIIDARRHRTQEQNRKDALARLVEMIRQASHKPKPRRPTRATLGSKLRRLSTKRRRSEVKSRRQRPGREE